MIINQVVLISIIVQRRLADAVKECEQVVVMNWTQEYNVKTDDSNLTEASAKQFLEDLLQMSRRSLERKRSISSVSGTSDADGPRVPQQPTTSTQKAVPSKLPETSPGVERDMR